MANFRFKVGDVITANPNAITHYTLTAGDFVGLVTHVTDHDTIEVKLLKSYMNKHEDFVGISFVVFPACFRLLNITEFKNNKAILEEKGVDIMSMRITNENGEVIIANTILENETINETTQEESTMENTLNTTAEATEVTETTEAPIIAEADEEIACNFCGTVHKRSEMTELDNGDFACPDCEDKIHKCEECGRYYFEEDMYYYDGNYYCNDNCKYEVLEFCDHCGECLGYADDRHGLWIENEEEYWCESCVDDDGFYCEDCESYYSSRVDSYEVNDGRGGYYTICQCCRDNNDYYCCDDCGDLFYRDDLNYHEGNDEYYCGECYENHEDDIIHPYDYKPFPQFYNCGNENGDNKLYMGVELEIDYGNDPNYTAEEILSTANNSEERLYIKTDGSLTSDGLELISHPMTYEYHINKMPWEDIMDIAKRNRYTSHNNTRCGLHIHVNRNYFGANEVEQNMAIARLLFFCETNYNSLVKFARRKTEQAERWANNYLSNANSEYSKKEDIKKVFDEKINRGGSRYREINLTNDNTIEFRIFRGTLKYNTFVATLQFVNGICKMAKEMSDEEFFVLDFNKVMANLIADNNNPELKLYLEERGMNISVPTIKRYTHILSEEDKKNGLLIHASLSEEELANFQFKVGDMVIPMIYEPVDTIFTLIKEINGTNDARCVLFRKDNDTSEVYTTTRDYRLNEISFLGRRLTAEELMTGQITWAKEEVANDDEDIDGD